MAFEPPDFGREAEGLMLSLCKWPVGCGKHSGDYGSLSIAAEEQSDYLEPFSGMAESCRATEESPGERCKKALLELYLLEGAEEIYKHAITIYLLLDIMHSFPNKTETSVDSFTAAFAIPWSLVKLIQGFWLLNHKDYENSLALLVEPAAIKPVSWQDMRILQSLMCQGEHRQALRYTQVHDGGLGSAAATHH
ncbi:protein ELYS-like [Phalacrocorax aristotelis]|uniref:protein ELYS-like n=1 Tax=Phalacrocorax aristotelis TaxID=126867 RepID=UPI003F4C8D19